MRAMIFIIMIITKRGFQLAEAQMLQSHPRCYGNSGVGCRTSNGVTGVKLMILTW